MPKVLAIQYTEPARQRLCVILSVTNWMCILTSLGLVGLGLFIKFSIEEFTNLVENYDGNTFPYLLIGIGSVSFCVSIGSGLLFYMAQDPGKRETIQHFLLVYIIVQTLVAVVCLAAGIMCYTHINHLEDSFASGFASAMVRYKSESHVKLEIDLMQSQFKCCGNRGYTDWFSEDWIDEVYKPDFAFGQPVIYVEEDVTYEPGVTRMAFHHDHVPASCCDVSSMRPCIHTDVHDNPRHVSYDYQNDLTLYITGCQEAMMNYYGDTVLANAGGGIFGIFILQIILVFVTRFLQTSVSGALATGDPEAPSDGFLLQYGPPEADAEGEGEGSDEDEDAEQEKPLMTEGMSDAGYAPEELMRASRHAASQHAHAHAGSHHSQHVHSQHDAAQMLRRSSRARGSMHGSPIGGGGGSGTRVYSRHSQVMSPQHPAALYDLPHGVPPPPPPPPLPNY